jgi:DNA polymerase I-like protein with 3'-5' exonuclease and polymerase domains
VPVIACHDEIVVECDADQAETVAAWLRQAMVGGMAPLIEPVPVVVRVSVGRSWAG